MTRATSDDYDRHMSPAIEAIASIRPDLIDPDSGGLFDTREVDELIEREVLRLAGKAARRRREPKDPRRALATDVVHAICRHRRLSPAMSDEDVTVALWAARRKLGM